MKLFTSQKMLFYVFIIGLSLAATSTVYGKPGTSRSRSAGNVKGTITWSDYFGGDWRNEDNDPDWLADDWGGRLHLDLSWLTYTGWTDCTNNNDEVWVEDEASCDLDMSDSTWHATIFSVKGNCGEGTGGCKFTYVSEVTGHWKGKYDGVDAKLIAEGSFTAVCMAGKTHSVGVSLKSTNGQSTVSDKATLAGEFGASRETSVSAGGSFRGVPVGLAVGQQLTGAVSVEREFEVVTNSTDPALWDRQHLVHTVYSLDLPLNSPPVRRIRKVSWSWIQTYTSFEDDTPERSGNTKKITWKLGTHSYIIRPYCKGP